MNYTKCPCQGCEKRSVGCHGTCQEYKEFQVRISRINQRKNDDGIVYGYIRDSRQRFGHYYDRVKPVIKRRDDE